MNWPGNLAPIVYGTPLGAAQLYATSPNAGTITYNPPAGTLLDSGPHTITMTFTPDDPANFHTVTSQKQIAVDKHTTTVTWNDTRVIVYGTALSEAELNATASTPGTFTYDPPAGTVLNAGTYDSMPVYFTPDESQLLRRQLVSPARRREADAGDHVEQSCADHLTARRSVRPNYSRR